MLCGLRRELHAEESKSPSGTLVASSSLMVVNMQCRPVGEAGGVPRTGLGSASLHSRSMGRELMAEGLRASSAGGIGDVDDEVSEAMEEELRASMCGPTLMLRLMNGAAPDDRLSIAPPAGLHRSGRR